MKKKYVKPRHKFIYKMGLIVLYPIAKFSYGLKWDKLKDKRAYLVLSNHQTGFDQFLISYLTNNIPYVVATEDIFSLGLASKIMKWGCYPIAFKKSTNDIHAVMECIKIAREGGTIAIFPEGNRTYSGKTESIKNSISKLAKKLALPIAIVNIEGGYSVKPRWADKNRKGHTYVKLKRVIEPEEYNKMTDDELNNEINDGLFVNESYHDPIVKSKHLAEYLERIIYVCPKCGLSEFVSDGDKVTCKHCHYEATYNGHNEFNKGSYFKNVNEWYEYQEDFIHNLSLDNISNDVIYKDKASLSEVILYKNKKLICKNIELILFKDSYVFEFNNEKHELKFDDISVVSVLGKNKLNLYYKNQVFQIKGDKRFNAVKYMHFYYHYININKGGDASDKREFLGL